MKIDTLELPQPAMQGESGGVRSLTSAVYQILRSSILYGHIDPGSKLRVSQLTRQFRVSLSAVREAMARLVAEGLLETEDHRGFRVAPVSREDLLDLTQTRIDIECMALRRSIERGDGEWATNVSAAFDALQKAERSHQLSQRRYAVHIEFHSALVQACGSPWLLKTLKMLLERSERYRLLSTNYTKVRTQVAHEHEQLFQAAAVERNAEKACAILAEHTRQTTQALLDADKRRVAARTAKDGKPPSPFY